MNVGLGRVRLKASQWLSQVQVCVCQSQFCTAACQKSSKYEWLASGIFLCIVTSTGTEQWLRTKHDCPCVFEKRESCTVDKEIKVIPGHQICLSTTDMSVKIRH